MYKKMYCLIFTCMVITGCNSTQNSTKNLAAPSQLISNTAQFNEVAVESQAQIFYLTQDIKDRLDIAIPHTQRSSETSRDLIKFIFHSADNNLDYQYGTTLTASDTFQQQNANCLSLSIMAFSMATYLGLETHIQKVFIPEYWALENGYNLLTSHVNLKLYYKEKKKDNVHYYFETKKGFVVDFDANSRREIFKTALISKNTLTAMFYNNKGAIAMVNNHYDVAYSYFKQAALIDPTYSTAWGNLAVLYRLQEDLTSAEIAYNYALQLDNNNNTAKGNLAILYSLTGRNKLAQKIYNELESKRQNNPYYHIAKGNEAYVQHLYRKAINHYKKSISLDRNLHESYFGLAKTYYELGDLNSAKRNMLKAKRNARYDNDINSYQGKINTLSAMVKH